MKKKVKKRGRSRYQRRLSAMALARLLILIMIVVPLHSMGGLAPGKVYASEYAAGKSAIIRIKDEGRADASESTGTEGNVSRSGISGKSRTSDQTDQINASADKTGAAAAEERSGLAAVYRGEEPAACHSSRLDRDVLVQRLPCRGHAADGG